MGSSIPKRVSLNCVSIPELPKSVYRAEQAASGSREPSLAVCVRYFDDWVTEMGSCLLTKVASDTPLRQIATAALQKLQNVIAQSTSGNTPVSTNVDDYRLLVAYGRHCEELNMDTPLKEHDFAKKVNVFYHSLRLERKCEGMLLCDSED